MEKKNGLKVHRSVLQFTYDKLLEYLQENHNFTREGLNRVTLSEILGINEKYLCLAVKTFSKGDTLKKVIENMRMKYAASLLLQYMNHPVEEIARMCGIESRCTFYRVFYRHFHCTPVAYRQNNYPLENREPAEEKQKTEPTLIGMGLSNLKQL